MHRETLSINVLPAWSKLNNVKLEGIRVSDLQDNRGSGLVATTKLTEENAILISIPPELLLSLENVWNYAKSDRHLLEFLEAVGDYARTARGAILIFLLMQIKSRSLTERSILSVANSWTTYVKFLPAYVPLPTFWSETERELLEGTSLAAALVAKLHSLDRELKHLCESIRSIEWCRHWLDPEDVNYLTIKEWKEVDAMYRSRALDLPGTGHAMVPCIDMANHASGDDTVALYDTDADANGILVLRDGKSVHSGEEVTITYGDEKGACELLFSYGFLEEGMTTARQLWLDIDIPDDDPLKLAKKAMFDAAPGFRLYAQDKSMSWEGPFVWLLCVNEEDGLDFRLLQKIDGERELTVSWKGDSMDGVNQLEQSLRKDIAFDFIHLRAVAIIQARVEQQLLSLEGSKERVEAIEMSREVDFNVLQHSMRLRHLEEAFLLHAYEDFEDQKEQLLKSKVVEEYLKSTSAALEAQDDFS